MKRTVQKSAADPSLKNQPKKPKSRKDWLWILVSFFLLFPIGFWALVQKMRKNPASLRRDSRITVALGLALVAAGLAAMLRVRLSSWDSWSLYIRSFLHPLSFVSTGLGLAVYGAYYLFLARSDEKYLRLIHEEHILSLDDLSLLTGDSLASVCDHLESAKERGRLSDVVIHYPEHSLALFSEEDPLFYLNVSRSGFSSPPEKASGSRDACRVLWITGAIIGCCGAYYTVIPGLMISGIALLLELRRQPRRSRTIFNCAVWTYAFVGFMVFSTGLLTMTDQTGRGVISLLYYIPCLLIPLFEASSGLFLAFRAGRYARRTMLEAARPSVPEEEIRQLAGRKNQFLPKGGQ